MSKQEFVPLEGYERHSEKDMIIEAEEFADLMKRRRTVRDFSSDPVPKVVIEESIRAAATAPNGANMQPWHFVIVEDADIKRQIRVAAEEEEKAFYDGRATPEWIEALAPLGTDWRKPFLETAPYLIVVFQQNYGLRPDGSRFKHYYIQESVGIAAGFLIACLHKAGLATLTHTPSPMGFLRDILKRPKNEKAVMILVVGHPDENAQVPNITKKRFVDICSTI